MARIVVIEDSELYSIFLEKKLKTSFPNEDFCFCKSGEEALKVDVSDSLVVVVDIMLGDMLGLKVIEEFKKKNTKLEFIVMTGLDFDWMEELAKKTTAFDYIKKDGKNDFVNLKNSINTILAIDKLRKEFDEKIKNLLKN